MKILKRLINALKRRVKSAFATPNLQEQADPRGRLAQLQPELDYHRALCDLGVNNPLSYLEETLLAILKHYPELDFVPVSALREEADSNKIKVAVRVDACGTLSAAVACSSIYARHGVPNTVFINHSASYFLEAFRNPDGPVAQLIREVSLCGSEVGLHTDFLGISSDRGVLRRRLRSDLGFLRSLGIVVEGAVSHNSAWSYGVENFRVFSDYSRIENEGSRVPQVGFLRDFGLEWDGSFHKEEGEPRAIPPEDRGLGGGDAVRSKDYLIAYFLQHPSLNRGYDFETWLLAEDAWVFADLANRQIHYPITREEMLVRLLDVPHGSKGVMLIHPEYVSQDIETSSLSPFSGGGRVG